MKITTEPQGMMGANCYMFSSEKTAVVIDPSAFTATLKSFLSENKDKELYVIATHRHCDHIAAVAHIKEHYAAKVCVSGADACGLLNVNDSLGTMLGLIHPTVSPDVYLGEGETTLGDVAFRVLHTPGHTEGSLCFIVDDVIFSGDTLFYLSIGRTDFPSGSFSAMQSSLTRLFSLPKDYKVYPGHGEPTSIFFERQNNPYYIREF